MRIFIGDSETTGLGNCKAVELAFVEVDPDTLDIRQSWQSLIDPEIPITPGASNIHGIFAEHVEDAPTLEEFVSVILGGPLEGEAVLIAHNCLTGDHEVLTLEGWVRLDSLEHGSTVQAAVWCPDTSDISFEACPVVCYEDKGPMLSWSTAKHKGVYTPDHRMYWKSSTAAKSKPWRVSTASEVSKLGANNVAIPCSGLYEPAEPLEITELEARILEMARADANLQEAGSTIRFRFKKERKISRCLALLDSAGIPYKVTVDKLGVTCIRCLFHPVAAKICRLLGFGKAKMLGSWVLQLSLKARKALLDEMQYWDGAASAREKGGALTTLSTANALEAEWIATAASLSGMCSSTTLDSPNTRGFSRPDSVLSRVSFREKYKVKTLVSPSVVDNPQGTVYCLQTRTGAFMVRRQGTTWVTGNCSFDKRFFEPILNIKQTFCTLQFARRLFPSGPPNGPENHQLGSLARYLGLEAGEAHRAMSDVMTVHQMLVKLLPGTGKTLPQLLSIPRHTIYTMPFGEHKGKPLADLPESYRRWLLAEANIDEDIRYSLLQLRAAGI